MEKHFALICLLSFLNFIRSEDINVKSQNILDKLLDPRVYDPRIRPSGTEGNSSATVVEVSLYVIDIFDLDIYLKEFSVKCYFRQRWLDQRLSHPESEGQSNIIFTQPERIWKPDLFFFNEISGQKHNIMFPNVFLKLKPNGELLMSVRVSITSRCHSDLSYFPHDRQTCAIGIESYGFPAKDINLKWAGSTGVAMDNEISDLQYSLPTYKLKKYISNINGTEYSRLILEFTFSRNSKVYIFNVYLPYILLVILSWGSFCLDNKIFAPRLALLIIIFFIMFHLTSDLGTLKSNEPYVTALDIWMAACLLFILAAFLEFLYVNSLSRKESLAKAPDEENDGLKPLVEVGKDSSGAKISQENKNKFIAKFQRKYKSQSVRIDAICRIVFPILFLLFNIVYWSVCCSNGENVD